MPEPILFIDLFIPYGPFARLFQNADDQYVKEAQVSLADDQGRSVRFMKMGQGLYQTTDSTFRGQVGRAYSLSIVLSTGKRYVSRAEQMPAIPAIDSVSGTLVKTGNFANPYTFSYAVNT
ncbi:hypothetical protein GCM10028774_12370 [Spirosoma jeollabukense]